MGPLIVVIGVLYLRSGLAQSEDRVLRASRLRWVRPNPRSDAGYSAWATTKWTSNPGRVILRLLLAAAEELVTGHGERRHAAISE